MTSQPPTLETLYDKISDLGNRREYGMPDHEYYPFYEQLNAKILAAEAQQPVVVEVK